MFFFEYLQLAVDFTLAAANAGHEQDDDDEQHEARQQEVKDPLLRVEHAQVERLEGEQHGEQRDDAPVAARRGHLEVAEGFREEAQQYRKEQQRQGAVEQDLLKVEARQQLVGECYQQDGARERVKDAREQDAESRDEDVACPEAAREAEGQQELRQPDEVAEQPVGNLARGENVQRDDHRDEARLQHDEQAPADGEALLLRCSQEAAERQDLQEREGLQDQDVDRGDGKCHHVKAHCLSTSFLMASR